jgi:hypothetical protein
MVRRFISMFFISKSRKPGTLSKLFLMGALLSVSVGIAAPRSAFAQSSTAGAIGGTVTDSSGALLPGSVITVTSTETGATKTVKANRNGEYRVDDLVPGVYTATFSSDGFAPLQENTITVTVGSLSAVSPKLKAGSISDKVVVTDETPLMHSQDSAISTTIDQTQIDNLPINGRRWSDFARLTPGVVSNSQGFGLLSFRGISFLLNNSTIDGADDNQAYYSEARGRTRTAFTVPPSAIQEFQVNTSNYYAQYGRAAGGVINTVTKSGSNTFHGELFFYDRDNDLGGATNPYTLLSVPNGNGTYTSVPTKPTDWRKDWGGTIGGPILHDKLFFIYTYDQERRNFPAISRPTDPNDVLAPSNATLPAGETCSTTAFTTTSLTYSAEGDYNACEIAALYGVSFQAGSAYYQQGLGVVASLIGIVPRRQDQVINLPKLDYQINDRNRLTLLYNRMRYSSPGGLYSQSSVTEGKSGFGNDNVKEDFGIVRLASVLTNSIINDALVQYGRDFEFDYQSRPQPNELPLSHNAYGAAAGTQIGYFTSGGFYAGSNPNLTRYADPDERRLQVLDGLTWSKGKHIFKFGLEFNKVSDFDNNLYNGNGSYSYDWAYTFIADYLNVTTGIGGTPTQLTAAGGPPATCGGAGKCYNQQYYTFSQEFGNPAGLITTREYAGYATDDWRVTPTLTLTLGVRYEYEYVPPNPYVNNGNAPLAAAAGVSLAQSSLPQSANRPDDRNNIGPRVGFSWNAFGDGNTIVRGGYGMYYGRIINSNILQTYLDSGGPNSQQSFSNLHPAQYTSASSGAKAGCGPVYPNLGTSSTAIYNCYQTNGGFNSSSAAYFDKHFQNPQVHEADLAIEQNLGHNTTFGVTYMMSLGRELPTAIDTNLALGSTVTAPYAVATTTTAPLSSYCISVNSECASSLAKYPLATITTGGYTTLPHGGKTPPAYPAGFQGKFFTGGAKTNSAFYQILDVKSIVNSSYHALAFQLDHRYQHGLSLLTNFTWSHGLDDNPYESTVVPGETALDPTNFRGDHGNSATDVRLRYVGAVVYQPQTHFHGILQQTLGGWRIAPLVQLQTGVPYSATVSTSALYNVGAYALTGSGVNGSGSGGATRVPWLDRNSFNYPKTAVFDMRLGKNFYLPTVKNIAGMRLELFAEVFNVMNHQNITGITTEAYTLTDSSSNVPTLTPYPLFGTYTNSNSNYTYSPRQVQIAARLHF